VVEQLAKEYAGKVKIMGANVDIAGDTASSLGITSIPALLFFKDGKEVSRLGPAPKQKIADEIRKSFGV
jgi:thioredoxin 1